MLISLENDIYNYLILSVNKIKNDQLEIVMAESFQLQTS